MNTLRFVIPFLLATLGPVSAFVVNVDGSNRAARWNLLTPTVSTNVVNPNTHAIRYFLASDGYSTTNTAAELNALRASFGQWQAISGTYLKFEEGGLVTPPVDMNLNDNTNIVYWTRSLLVNGGTASIGGALGYTLFSLDGNNNILQADIALNAAIANPQYVWFTDFTSPNTQNVFVEGVALHEIGHLIGLRHSPVGGATMRYAGISGVNVQAGLSSDEVLAARYLYPLAATNNGAIKGTVTRAGVPILGAAVFAQDAVTNVVAGTVSQSDGTYLLGSLPPGNYLIRVAPLDRSDAAYFLIRGTDINADYASAETSFPPTTNVLVTVTANVTNTANFAVTAAEPAFRISHLRRPGTGGGFSYASAPYSILAGSSNYSFGVASTNLPTSGATLTLTGDGLTIGTPSYLTLDLDFSTNTVNGTMISASISVASNATPGLRSIIVQQGGNIAYANACLEILAPVTDYNFDGLDDIFQRQYFPVFTAPEAAPGADPDGDKFNNYSEYIAGTNPTNAASYLAILGTTTTVGGTTVTWMSVNGKRYQVSSRSTVVTSSWQDIGSPVTAANITAQYLDTTATNGMRFYRVQALP